MAIRVRRVRPDDVAAHGSLGGFDHFRLVDLVILLRRQLRDDQLAFFIEQEVAPTFFVLDQERIRRFPLSVHRDISRREAARHRAILLNRARGGRDHTRLESEHFTQSLLDEALGSYIAPDVPYESHAAYLREVFAVPENRVRADRFHTRLITELGKLWGTLLALGGYSH